MKHLANKLNTMMRTVLFTSLCASTVGVYADDTEVFYSVNVSKPNLLFVLDVSGSMNTMVEGAATGDDGSLNQFIDNGSNDSYQNNWNGARTSGSQSIDMNTGHRPRFRFTNITIPRDSEIIDARIQFTSTDADTGNARFRIRMDRSGDAPQTTNYFNTPLVGTADWNTNNSWSTGDRGDNQRTSNIAWLVQNIVTRSDWQSGNAMGFYFQPTDSNRKVAAFEHNTLQAPELIVTYKEDSQSRLEVMKSSFRAVLEQAPDNVQVGVMNYGQANLTNEVNNGNQEKHRHHSVSGVAFPITDINEKAQAIITSDAERHGLPSPSETITIREYIADIADNWNASSFTPIVDALYEAALYYRGEKMHYGHRLTSTGGAHPKTYNGNTVTLDITDTSGPGRDATNTQKYRTPIESSCQENYIVLMTDGAPTYRYRNDNGNWISDEGPFAKIRGGGQGPQGALASAINSCVEAAGVGEQGNCGAELTHYLANNDNLPNSTSAFPDGQPGEQPIGTFTVGFGVGTSTETYLKSLATIDDGNADTDDDGYFAANSPEELAKAFKDIFDAVAAPKGTLASPGYSVNVKSGLEHEQDIYIPVFDRRNTSRWAGNLKKFKIEDIGGKRKIRGSNGLDAVDELGGFLDQAIDYWSSAPNNDPDGKVVQRGGLANLLDPADRNIVSDIVSNNLSTDIRNKIVVDNASLTNDVLGLAASSDQDYRNTIINFMRGWKDGDATSDDKEKRYHMGDMLHSEPLVITYDPGTNVTNKKQYIFAGTNEGYFHAFDTSDTGANAGKEMFAFIPKELLGSLAEHQYLNAGSQQDHRYGVDGALTYRFIDIDEDGVVDTEDQVILYFGLRRGGTSYYALDVTDIDSPSLLWKVSRSSVSSNPLYRLGQSWSAPYLARVGVDDSSSTCRISKTETKTHCKEVVIVTGGYDDADDRDERTFCSDENGTCTLPSNLSTTVWYGANGTWVPKNNVVGSIACNNATFGDPLVGVRKSCKYELEGGDYDSTSSVTANMGNDVFIFDADDGTLVWSLPSSEKVKLTNSTPGGVRILDTNSNKMIDRMYFGDTGGNLWRLDLSEKITSNDSASKLTKLADLSGTGSQARMFFNEPDVSRLKINGKTRFLVSIGSGYRAHPLDKAIDDKFFMIVDESPYTPLDLDPSSADKFTTISPSELAQITITDNSVTQTNSIKTSKGWMANLPSDGEKVLATSVTVDGVVLFTTLVPEVLASGVGIDQCAAPATQGRLYAIDILSGGKAKDPLAFELDTSSSGTPSTGTSVDVGGGGTFSTISKGEIPGKPQAIFNKLDVNDSTGECSHPVDVRIGKKLSQATGYEACRLESIYWSDPESN